MNAEIARRSFTKGGRDAGVIVAATLITQVVAERIDLSQSEYGLLLGGLTILCGWAYRMARDHGLVLPEGVDEPVPEDLAARIKARIRADGQSSNGTGPIGGAS